MNNDYEIKMDGEKDSFEGGAIRYTKTGKGRFDLIPGEIIVDVINHAYDTYYSGGCMTTSKTDIIQCAYQNGVARYYDTIINLINWRYVDDGYVTTDDNGIESVETDFHKFLNGLVAMLEQLAHHYEKGATAYGVDNWKKGIPVIGGERGGSFTDSMLRHLNQFLEKRTDENHEIACIWNAIGALYASRYNENIE